MSPPQSTDPTDPRTDPFRWDHHRIATVLDRFHDPDHPTSQRQFAKQHDIPRSTLGSWLRLADPEGLDPDLVAFLRSSSGLAFLRRVVLALFLVFVFRGACGVRLLGLFLRLSYLDRFVASCHGALHELGWFIQADLGTFANEERSRLAVDMAPKAIALVADEHFHADSPCLVAIEPVSNFLLLEQYADHRDAATWTTVITAAIEGLPVEVVLLTSDQAKGLIACANSGLQARHLPELFHGQRDLGGPFVGPLERQKESAQKELQKAQELDRYWREQPDQAQAGPAQPGRPKDYGWRIEVTTAWVAQREQQVRACEARQEQSTQAVRGLADDFHPFDAKTGAGVSAAQMEERLGKHVGTAAERFFGQKPREVFAWLLERLPDLPRPAAKRPKKEAQIGPIPG